MSQIYRAFHLKRANKKDVHRTWARLEILCTFSLISRVSSWENITGCICHKVADFLLRMATKHHKTKWSYKFYILINPEDMPRANIRHLLIFMWGNRAGGLWILIYLTRNMISTGNDLTFIFCCVLVTIAGRPRKLESFSTVPVKWLRLTKRQYFSGIRFLVSCILSTLSSWIKSLKRKGCLPFYFFRIKYSI